MSELFGMLRESIEVARRHPARIDAVVWMLCAMDNPDMREVARNAVERRLGDVMCPMRSPLTLADVVLWCHGATLVDVSFALTFDQAAVLAWAMTIEPIEQPYYVYLGGAHAFRLSLWSESIWLGAVHWNNTAGALPWRTEQGRRGRRSTRCHPLVAAFEPNTIIDARSYFPIEGGPVIRAEKMLDDPQFEFRAIIADKSFAIRVPEGSLSYSGCQLHDSDGDTYHVMGVANLSAADLRAALEADQYFRKDWLIYGHGRVRESEHMVSYLLLKSREIGGHSIVFDGDGHVPEIGTLKLDEDDVATFVPFGGGRPTSDRPTYGIFSLGGVA